MDERLSELMAVARELQTADIALRDSPAHDEWWSPESARLTAVRRRLRIGLEQVYDQIIALVKEIYPQTHNQ
jgi:hypothetical protein